MKEEGVGISFIKCFESRARASHKEHTKHASGNTNLRNKVCAEITPTQGEFGSGGPGSLVLRHFDELGIEKPKYKIFWNPDGSLLYRDLGAGEWNGIRN
jgi:hypothetical protein